MRLRSTNHLLKLIAYACLSHIAQAGDITTVPWNGFSGAVSFTFDDALQTQLDNVVPALKQRNIHATFFLYDVGGAFTNNKALWVAAAKDGNELANHSVSHADFSKSIDANYEVSDMASRLRNADASIQASTFAFPYCAIGYEPAVQSENIIGRGCWFMPPFTPMKWNSPPSNWNNVGAIYIGDDATATGPTITALDAAKTGGWIVTLAHGVGGDWVAITKNNMYALFDRALQNGLWVGTFMEVAAYWRAGLTMDTVHAVKSGLEWNLSWKSPHPKMPKSVLLKIRPSETTFGKSFVVRQNGKSIPPSADGSFAIEFMTLSLTIQETGAVSSSQLISSNSSISQTAFSSATIPGTIQIEHFDVGGEGVAYHDSDPENSGNLFRQEGVDLDAVGLDNYAIGWTLAGEWLEYTIHVLKTGTVLYKATVASGMDSSAFHIELDGNAITPSIIVPNTGGWSTYQEVSGSVEMPSSGIHVLRVVIDESYCNLDQIQFLEPSSMIERWQSPQKSFGQIHYKIYDVYGNLKFAKPEIPSDIPPGVWVVVEENAWGKQIKSWVTRIQ